MAIISNENTHLAKSLVNRNFEWFLKIQFAILRIKNNVRIFANRINKKHINMTQIKVLGPGCPKCKTTYNNVLEALKQTNIEANVEKIEDIEEMMKYNVLTTPVLMIDDEMKIKGRIAQVREIVELLKR